MTLEERNVFMSSEYAESIRYMDNAKETLKKAEKHDYGWYKDEKYVRSACGIAYLGVLRAIDAWLMLKEVPLSGKKKQKSIDLYEYMVAKIDKKMLDYLLSAYNVLHLEGYYRRERSIDIISGGFKAAYCIIEKIKPENPVEVAETRSDKVKRAWNNLLISMAVTFKF